MSEHTVAHEVLARSYRATLNALRNAKRELELARNAVVTTQENAIVLSQELSDLQAAYIALGGRTSDLPSWE